MGAKGTQKKKTKPQNSKKIKAVFFLSAPCSSSGWLQQPRWELAPRAAGSPGSGLRRHRGGFLMRSQFLSAAGTPPFLGSSSLQGRCEPAGTAPLGARRGKRGLRGLGGSRDAQGQRPSRTRGARAAPGHGGFFLFLVLFLSLSFSLSFFFIFFLFFFLLLLSSYSSF